MGRFSLRKSCRKILQKNLPDLSRSAAIQLFSMLCNSEPCREILHRGMNVNFHYPYSALIQ